MHPTLAEYTIHGNIRCRPKFGRIAMPADNIIALWGAALSTFLAVLKAFEVYNARARLSVSYSFSTPEFGGNKVILENYSSIPIMVSYWELCLVKKNLLRSTTIRSEHPGEGYCDITIGSHARYTLVFDGENWFPWGGKSLEGGVWYIKLFTAGKRKPTVKRVYP